MIPATTPEEHDDAVTSALLARDLVVGYVVYNRSTLIWDGTSAWWTQCAWVRCRDPKTYSTWLTPRIEEALVFDSVLENFEHGLLAAESGGQSYCFGSPSFGYLPIYGCPKTNGLAALADNLDAAYIPFRMPRNP